MRNLPLTLILALWADDRISVRNTHNKKNLKEKLTRVSHAAENYFHNNIVWGKRHKGAGLTIQRRWKPFALEVDFSFSDIVLISFFVKLLETCPEEVSSERLTVAVRAGRKPLEIPLIPRRRFAECSCAQCYCPLGDKPGIIGAGSDRWLLQLQQQKNGGVIYQQENSGGESAPLGFYHHHTNRISRGKEEKWQLV